MFGDELKVKPGESFTLSFDLESVAGMKQIELIGGGAVLRTEAFQTVPQRAHADFPLTTQSRTWYSLIAEDNLGHKAYTDPVWVDVVAPPGMNPAHAESQRTTGMNGGQ
jgi:hypothetical protein